MKIKEITVSRSYGRKIKGDRDYEMVDLWSSYSATLTEPTDEELAAISEKIYQKAEQEIELQVDIRQNPGRVVRGFASINELKTIIKAQTKKIEEQDKKINELEIIIKQTDKPF